MTLRTCYIVTALVILGPSPGAGQQLTPSGWYPCNSASRLTQRITSAGNHCCQGFGQEDNCDVTGVPSICDTRCSQSFIPFMDECHDILVAGNNLDRSTRMAFEGVYGLCQATQADNVVHDTDPVTPGDQFDPNTPLTADVHCHNDALTTANELNDNTGPMDGLWMLGVNGDSSCLYTDAGRADPSSCEVMQNKQALMDAMGAEFGTCNLLTGCTDSKGCSPTPNQPGGGHRRNQYVDNPTMICDWTMDTNGDGEVGDGDDLWSGGMFGAIASKDAVYFMVTNSVTAPLVSFAECDEVMGGR